MATSEKEKPISSVSYDSTLEKVMNGLSKMGSLPIFSASVNRIRYMSSSDETEVMELANEIMKDASLASKLIRVTNSSQYNHGNTKISTISRAIVILGYETIKSITMALKVIDSFQHKNSSVDINGLLAKSFMSAGFVKDIAVKSSVKNPEECYLCALLHNLGEIIVATILTKKYDEMLLLVASEDMSWGEVQKKVLGATLNEIAQAVFKKWKFPDTVIKTVENYSKKNDGPVKDKTQLNRALASISNRIIGTIYSPDTAKDQEYNELISDLSEASGLEIDVVSTSLVDSFKVSCDLAEEYGLNKKALTPKVSNDGGSDPAREKIAMALSFFVGSNKRENLKEDESEVGALNTEETTDGTNAVQQNKFHEPMCIKERDPEVIISTLNEITNSILLKSDINSIFGKILEGINYGVGFDRAILCFLSPDRKQYKARLGSGANIEKLKEYFSFELDVKNDIFSQILLGGKEVFVQDAETEKWKHLLPKDFLLQTNARSFVVASLKLGDKPIGFFFADTGTTQSNISVNHFSGFIQFVSQAKLALTAR